MLDIIMMSKNAIEAYNAQLRITASNIANMEVAGYKRLNVSFQSVFEKAITRGTAASATTQAGGTNPIQLGTGAGIGNISVDFTQGSFAEGTNYDLAIQGNGLFIVSPDGGNTKLYTRNGQFTIDANGNMVTTNGGLQVYGTNPSGGLIPIKLSGFTVGERSRMSWDESGELWIYNHANWSATPEPSKVRSTGYTIALTSFNNRSGLAQSTGTNFSETVASGRAFNPEAPGGIFGYSVARNYEKSNVFLTSETIDSLAAQSALNGNLSILRSINEEISNFINKLG